jgi:hypothetical protein
VAVQLAAFPETNYHRYDWSTWAKNPGTVWQLRRGEDMAISPADMARRAYTYAEKHGMRARTSQIGEETLILQFMTT